jgi:hypothetical protein
MKNLIEDEYLSKILDITYDLSIIKSCSPVIRNVLYPGFLEKFYDLIQNEKFKENYEIYFNELDQFNGLNKDFESYRYSTKSYLNFEIDVRYNFLNENFNDTLLRLGISKTTSYEELKNIYRLKSKDLLSNQDFLKVFIVKYGSFSMYELIDMYIDIVSYLKIFEKVNLITFFIYDSKGNLRNEIIYKYGFGIFFKALISSSYFLESSDLNLKINKIYDFMDENFDTNNPIVDMCINPDYPNLILYEGEELGLIPKKDRMAKTYEILNPFNNWAFSNIIQVENAFQRKLITKEKYDKKISFFNKKNITIMNQFKSLSFLEIKDEKSTYVPKNGVPYCHSINYHFRIDSFDCLNEEQKYEYLKAFSNEGDLHGVIKYGRLRICTLFSAFIENNNLEERILLELDFIKKYVYYKEEVQFIIDNIKAYNKLKEIDMLDYANKLINDYNYEEIFIKFENILYRFYNKLSYNILLETPYEVYKLIEQGGNISKEQYCKENNIPF